jgi:hypothetical protein
VTFSLKPHQSKNVDELVSVLKRHGGALDASGLGTGKTFTFLGLCKATGARPAIVTRKTILPSWVDACKTVGVEPVFITNYEQLLSDGFPFTKTKWKTTTQEKVMADGSIKTVENRSRAFEGWDLPDKRVIFAFDEAQALRARGSFASKAALGARSQFKSVLLSATPFATPLEAEVIGQIIGLFQPKDYYPWLFRHGCRKNQFKYWEFIGDVKDRRDKEPGANAAKGHAIMQQLHREIFPEHGVRTLTSEIPGFPETQIVVDAVETGHADEITQLYLAELEERRARDLERAAADVDPEFHGMVEVLPIVRDLRFRQEAELLMVSAICEMAHDARAKGSSVLIFVNFDKTVDLLAKKLDCDQIIRGDGQGKNPNNYGGVHRARVVENFQRNYKDLVIINSAAGGAGLSLQDPYTQKPRESLIVPPYSAVLMKQILGRPCRLGGGFSRQRLLFAAGTIAEKVLMRVQNRLGNIEMLTDGDLDLG